MSITDKVTGKAKQVVGDLKDDTSLRREGRDEERKGEKKEQLAAPRIAPTARPRRSRTSSARPEPAPDQSGEKGPGAQPGPFVRCRSAYPPSRPL